MHPDINLKDVLPQAQTLTKTLTKRHSMHTWLVVVEGARREPGDGQSEWEDRQDALGVPWGLPSSLEHFL